MSAGYEPYRAYIYGVMLTYIGNPYGVCALMGNWVAESGLIPYRVQGDFSNQPKFPTSQKYTHNVDSGAISEYNFVHNGPGGGGYGLAQWTYYTRKQGMYNLHKSSGYSIGSAWLGCAWAWQELSGGYRSTLEKLQSATQATMKDASDYVLHHYEQPADQSSAAENARYKNAVDVYNICSGLPPLDPDIPFDPDIPITGSSGKFWMYLRRRY